MAETKEERIVVELFGGTILSFPADQRDDPNSHYNMFRESLASSHVWLYDDNRWMADMPTKRVYMLGDETDTTT
jgi:hypothetical protein